MPLRRARAQVCPTSPGAPRVDTARRAAGGRSRRHSLRRPAMSHRVSRRARLQWSRRTPIERPNWTLAEWRSRPIDRGRSDSERSSSAALRSLADTPPRARNNPFRPNGIRRSSAPGGALAARAELRVPMRHANRFADGFSTLIWGADPPCAGSGPVGHSAGSAAGTRQSDARQTSAPTCAGVSIRGLTFRLLLRRRRECRAGAPPRDRRRRSACARRPVAGRPRRGAD
jgi:hypothetical protein